MKQIHKKIEKGLKNMSSDKLAASTMKIVDHNWRVIGDQKDTRKEIF